MFTGRLITNTVAKSVNAASAMSSAFKNNDLARGPQSLLAYGMVTTKLRIQMCRDAVTFQKQLAHKDILFTKS